MPLTIDPLVGSDELALLLSGCSMEAEPVVVNLDTGDCAAIYESQASYLEHHDLFLPGERRRVRKANFEARGGAAVIPNLRFKLPGRNCARGTDDGTSVEPRPPSVAA